MPDPVVLDLTMYRGDDYVHQLVFVDDQNPPMPFDLSDSKFKAQIRDRPEFGKVVYADFDIDDSDASIGVIVISLPGSFTRFPFGFWDFQIDYGSDSQTIIQGSVTMSGDVTQGTII